MLIIVTDNPVLLFIYGSQKHMTCLCIYVALVSQAKEKAKQRRKFERNLLPKLTPLGTNLQILKRLEDSKITPGANYISAAYLQMATSIFF